MLSRVAERATSATDNPSFSTEERRVEAQGEAFACGRCGGRLVDGKAVRNPLGDGANVAVDSSVGEDVDAGDGEELEGVVVVAVDKLPKVRAPAERRVLEADECAGRGAAQADPVRLVGDESDGHHVAVQVTQRGLGWKLRLAGKPARRRRHQLHFEVPSLPREALFSLLLARLEPGGG